MEESLVGNEGWMNKDDDEKDVAKDATDGDDTIHATIDNDINLFVHTRICSVVRRNN